MGRRKSALREALELLPHGESLVTPLDYSIVYYTAVAVFGKGNFTIKAEGEGWKVARVA